MSRTLYKLCPVCQRPSRLVQDQEEGHCDQCGKRLPQDAANIDASRVLEGRSWRYLLDVQPLGSGGMGSVHRSVDKDGRPVAIKRPIERTEESKQRFQEEARIIALLSGHRHVVTLYERSLDENGLPFLVLEYLKGESLDAILERTPVLPPQRALGLWQPAAKAMAAAHEQGVIHRDLKPHNIFVAQSFNEEVVKVLDFGIARVDDGRPRLTQAPRFMGSIWYMAPEQRYPPFEATARSDVYALATILVQMFTGKMPWAQCPDDDQFPAVDRSFLGLRRLRPEVTFPQELDELLGDALSNYPVNRPPNASELLHQVAHVLEKAPTPWPERQEAPSAPIEMLSPHPIEPRPSSTSSPRREAIRRDSVSSDHSTSQRSRVGVALGLVGVGLAAWLCLARGTKSRNVSVRSDPLPTPSQIVPIEPLSPQVEPILRDPDRTVPQSEKKVALAPHTPEQPANRSRTKPTRVTPVAPKPTPEMRASSKSGVQTKRVIFVLQQEPLGMVLSCTGHPDCSGQATCTIDMDPKERCRAQLRGYCSMTFSASRLKDGAKVEVDLAPTNPRDPCPGGLSD